MARALRTALASDTTLDQSPAILTHAKCPSILWLSRAYLAPRDNQFHRHPAPRDNKNRDFSRDLQDHGQRYSSHIPQVFPGCSASRLR